MSKKNICPEPGLRIRRLRESLGLSRVQFAEITGTSASTLRSLEVGDLELTPQKARLYSNLFIYMFEIGDDEAGVDIILYGEQRNSQPAKKKIIIR